MPAKKYKTRRVVVEVNVPENITEHDLVWALKRILKYPIQLGTAGNLDTLVRPDFKEFSRVYTYMQRKTKG